MTTPDTSADATPDTSAGAAQEAADAAAPDPAPEASGARARAAARQALHATGRLTWRALQGFGGLVAQGYRAIDPDLRRHAAEGPLLGLSALSGGDAPPAAPKPDDGARPVLFVHGLGGHPGNFVGLRALLRLNGRTRHYAFPLGGGDLAEIGARLAAHIQAVCDVNGLPRERAVDLVAHSMGGIVCRLALTDPAAARCVSTLVTLGTPHRGTWLARYADTPTTQALRPGSALLRSLDAQIPWGEAPDAPALPKLVALWSDADMLLVPHETGAVPGADNIPFPGLTHYGYLLRPVVWRCVYRVLDEPAARVASPT